MLGNRKVAIRAWMRWHRNGIGQSAITLADMAALGAGSVVRGNAAITLADMTAAGVGDAGPETIQSLGMMGGQFNANDGMRAPVEIDLMDRARCFTYPSGTGLGNNAFGKAYVSSIVRSSNVCTVTLSAAPGENPGDFVMRTGMHHALTCISDPAFSDYGVITVTDQTHYTYANTGSNATAVIANVYDCPNAILGSVAVGSNGEPIEDFRVIVSSKVGSETKNIDLDGDYDIIGTVAPATISVTGGSIVGTVLTLDGTDTELTYLTFTDVPGDGSWVRPRIVRQDQSADPDYVIRSDYAVRTASYTAGHRWMDAQHDNSNPSQVLWANRAKAMNGTTWTPEKIIGAANQLMQPAWATVPELAANDYIDGMAALYRDDLDESLYTLYEHGNEEWNLDLPAYHQGYWRHQEMKYEVGGIFHGDEASDSDMSNDDLVSVVRASGVTTVTTVRPLPSFFANGSTCDVRMEDDTFDEDGATVTKTGANSFTYPNSGSNGAASSLNGAIFGNLASNLLNDTLRNTASLRHRWVGRRTYEIAQRIKTVYSGVLNDKARMVMMLQSANLTQHGIALNHVLPWLEATYGVAINTWLYAVGSAPYHQGSGGSATAITTSIMGAADDSRSDLHGAKYLAAKYGVRLWLYEGGPGMITVNSSLTDAVYVHASFQTATEYSYNTIYGYRPDTFFPYKTDLRWPGTSGSSSWGAGSDMDSITPVGSASSPKQAGMDAVLQGPLPPILETNLIPGTVRFMSAGGAEVYDNKVLGSGTFSANGMHALGNANAMVETLCYIPAAGNYDLTIWGKFLAGGGGANACRVYVIEDAVETSLGTLALFTDGTDIFTGDSGGYASPTALNVNFSTAGWKILKCRGAVDPQPDRLAVSKIVGV